MVRPKRAGQSEPLSSVIGRLNRTLPEEDQTIGTLLHALGSHGFKFFILVLALLNLVIFMLPGLSLLLGLPMIILSVQMLLGLHVPVLPDFVHARKIRGEALHRGLSVAAFLLQKIEPVIRPRLTVLGGEWFLKVHYLLALFLSLLMAIPFPFLNLPPTLAIVSLMLGLLQYDGLFILIAYAMGGWSLWIYESIGRHAQTIFG